MIDQRLPLPFEPPTDLLTALRAHYITPQRAYHHFGHVQEVLAHYQAVAAGPGWQQPGEVAMAVLYHDAVYRPARRDNETASAALMREELMRLWPENMFDLTRIASLITMTARHGQWRRDDFSASVDQNAVDAHLIADTLHFLDCDMAILGAPETAFADYDRAIAQEYAGHVPAWLFRRKRRQFFEGLLACERIFLSDFFHDRLERAARANLMRRLATKSH